MKASLTSKPMPTSQSLDLMPKNLPSVLSALTAPSTLPVGVSPFRCSPVTCGATDTDAVAPADPAIRGSGGGTTLWLCFTALTMVTPGSTNWWSLLAVKETDLAEPGDGAETKDDEIDEDEESWASPWPSLPHDQFSRSPARATATHAANATATATKYLMTSCGGERKGNE